MEVVRYQDRDAADWGSLLRASKNGSFHLSREFLVYHGARFTDHSLLVRDGASLVACIPAAEMPDGVFFSHPGLTYGGVVIGASLYLTEFLRLFAAVVDYLLRTGFTSFVLRNLPPTYGRGLSHEADYAMHLAGARVRSFDVLPHVSPFHQVRYQHRRTRAVGKARKLGVRVGACEDLAAYWKILRDLLAEYGSEPVHSLDQITWLRSRFPAEIRLYGAWLEDDLVAGVLVFDTGTVVRAQYIAASQRGKSCSALDLVLDLLIRESVERGAYLDLGTTTREGGIRLNRGLSDQKEGFGARTVVQYSYELLLSDFRRELFVGAGRHG